MNAGYVRLSRDDDKRNYSSIENQKLIITQYAAVRNISIDRWYEDDGVSGYIFDRPGFRQLMADLDQGVDTVFVKDFSRLGRHNAKILLLLDEFREKGKRLVAIDDHYDSESSEDDMIGIMTWFNERYVKDTSRKIRHAIEAKQKEGTLKTRPPFGYRRCGKNGERLEIVPREAECIKNIYDLYLQGWGYRKISVYLTEQGIATPSMERRKRELEEGRSTSRRIAAIWSDSMVRDLLDNDFYVGTFRLKKRARHTVHGKDRRIPKDEQYIFENHHPAIIDKMTFDLVQELRKKRTKTNYKGSRELWTDPGTIHLFGGYLYCKDCGRRLTPVVRQTSAGKRKYYICSTYNTKGNRGCLGAHLVGEDDLKKDVIHYIRMCRNLLSEKIAAYDMKEITKEQTAVDDRYQMAQKEIYEAKDQLRVLLSQKIRDLAAAPDRAELIEEGYGSVQMELTSRIDTLELLCDALQCKKREDAAARSRTVTALDVIDAILSKNALARKDIEILIERIEVDENGLPEINLRYSLPSLLHRNAEKELNCCENEILLTIVSLIGEKEDPSFISVRWLSGKLAEMGYPRSKKGVMTYIRMLMERGVIVPGDNNRKPYIVQKSSLE